MAIRLNKVLNFITIIFKDPKMQYEIIYLAYRFSNI